MPRQARSMSTSAAITATPLPAFQHTSTAADLNTPDECMVSSGTAYRSLEINTNGDVSEGRSGCVVHDDTISCDQDRRCVHPAESGSSSTALSNRTDTRRSISGETVRTVYGTQAIVPSPSGPSGSLCYGVGINRSIQPSRYFAWDAGCYLKADLPSGFRQRSPPRRPRHPPGSRGEHRPRHHRHRHLKPLVPREELAPR